MRIECKRCHYQTNKQEIPARCPYCGEPNTMVKARVAQDILDEVKKDDLRRR